MIERGSDRSGHTPAEGAPAAPDEPGSGAGGNARETVSDAAHESALESVGEADHEPLRDPEARATSSRGASALSSLDALIPRLALIVAVIATALAGFLLWQYRQFYVALDGADAALADGLEASRASQRRLADEVEALDAALAEARAASQAEAERLARDLETLPAEVRTLGRRIDALQGVRLDVRETWLRTQAEYYLSLANAELNLAGRFDSAIAALELADDVLRSLSDPSLSDVRAAIAEELQRLRAVDRPDLERVMVELAGLIARLPELPMLAGGSETFTADDAAGDDIEPGLGRLWHRVKGAVTGIVRVERRDQPVDHALTEAERRIVRRQLALELQLARVAAAEGREEAFRASLEQADAILLGDFDRDAASVNQARRLLGELVRVDLVPPRPDISGSLTLLRASPRTE